MKGRLLRTGGFKKSYRLALQDHLFWRSCFGSACVWLGWWETPWIYIVVCDFKRCGWHLNGLLVGAFGGGFVAMRGKPRKVGTQLVLFIGPTGYHRSPAQTEFRRDKDSMGKKKKAGTLQNESIRGGTLCRLKQVLTHLVSNLEGMK